MTSNFGLDDLGIRQANFYVNKRSSMPSTLIEMAFVTNAKEEKIAESAIVPDETGQGYR